MKLLSSWFRRSEVNREMEDELRSHIEHRADDLERSGVFPRAEAERRARIEFGGYERVKEEIRETAGTHFIETLIQDVRFAFRVLSKSPGFTVTAVLTLALAIGANAVVFGIMNALILRPLNVPQAQSLYGIQRGNDKSINHSYPDYLDLRDRNHSFEDLTAYNVTAVGIDTGNNPSASWIMEVTGNYFDALGIQPFLGRYFHAADEHGPNSAPFIVLTYAYWHAHFQDDRGVVGRVVQLNKHPYTIIGVAPREFRGTISFLYPDFWVPLINQESVEWLNARGSRNLLMVMGHLKAGATPAQAIADLNAIGSSLEKTYPKDDGNMTFSLTRPSLAGDWLNDPVREFLTGLMLLAGLILLAACANLGSLFAARAADRSKEVAVRLALGSSPVRSMRQLLTEAVLVALIGGAVGLWGSVVLLRGLSVWRPLPMVPLNVPVQPDANVYGVALLLALVSGFLFGAMPVRQVLHTDPYQVIKSGSTGRVRGQNGLRDVLLVLQISICAVLVTSSMVAVRGLMRSLHSNFGFEPQNAMLVGTNLSMAGYAGDAVPIMQKRIRDALQALPGVESVGLVDRPPLYYGANDSNVFSDKTADMRPANAAADAMVYKVSPEYFAAARTTLLAGRMLTSHDDKESPRVALINREFASKIFGSAKNATGAYYKMPDGTRVQVAGIVEDGKYGSLTEPPQPAVFFPLAQSPSNDVTAVVRSNRDRQQLTAAIHSTIEALDAALPFDIQTWDHELDGAMFAPRIATVALGVMGMMGAMLAVTGIFGMAAYSVSKRMKEFGIRIAIGAQPRQVVKAALARAFKLLAIGSAVGLMLGLAAGKVLAFVVYQATPRDPLVLAGVVLAMGLLGMLATWIPALRALSTDPLVLLREE